MSLDSRSCELETFSKPKKFTRHLVVNGLFLPCETKEQNWQKHILIVGSMWLDIGYLNNFILPCFFFLNDCFRGLVKLKKSERNSDWPEYTHPPPIQFFFFFFGDMNNNTKITKKTSQLAFNRPTHFSRFFWIFFNLTKPLNLHCCIKFAACVVSH